MSEKVLTRQQRRIQERVSEEANKTLLRLTKIFYDCFMENTPDSEIVKQKQKELSAKWKMYCHRMKLIEKTLTFFDDNCNELLKEYRTQLESK